MAHDEGFASFSWMASTSKARILPSAPTALDFNVASRSS